MSEEIETLDTVPAPLYAWRAYRVVGRGEGKGLAPIFMSTKMKMADREVLTSGEPGNSTAVNGELEWAWIDLLDWIVADSPPLMYAIDVRGQEGPVPDQHGIHAFHGKGQAVKYATDFTDVWASNYTFGGQEAEREVVMAYVELQGYVVEHEMGYRAEKIRIIELHAGGDDEHREKLANDIGWPFEIHECDLLPVGPVKLKKPPIITINADVSAFTLALSGFGSAFKEAAAMAEQANRQIMKDVYQYSVSATASGYSDPNERNYKTREILHEQMDFLEEFYFRDIVVNWGAYTEEPYFITPLDKRLRAERASTNFLGALGVSRGFRSASSNKYSGYGDHDLLLAYGQFLRDHGIMITVDFDKNPADEDQDIWGFANSVNSNYMVQAVMDPPAEFYKKARARQEARRPRLINNIQIIAEQRLALQVHKPSTITHTQIL